MKRSGRPWSRLLRRFRIHRDREDDAVELAPECVPVVFRDDLLDAIQDIEDLYRSQGRLGCLTTGFPDFDRLTGGPRAGEMIVIASAPGMGKTVLALNMAAHVAVELSQPVAIFSLEASRRELAQRLLCSQSGVPMARVRSGALSPSRDLPRLQRAAARMAESVIHVEDPVCLSVSDLRSRLRELTESKGLRLAIVDSLQWLAGRESVEAAARELKQCARELGIVILVMAQLDPPPVDREWGRPSPAELGSCRAVEQLADVVALLWRQDYFGALPEDYDADFSRASLIVVKNRHGALGEVPLLFRKEVPRFENRALESLPTEI